MEQPIIIGLLLLFVFAIIMGGWYTVKQQSAVVIQRFGKFQATSFAGFHFKVPVIDKKAGTISMKIQQLDVNVETKTKDDVFVHLQVSVQYHVLKDKVYDAFLSLGKP